MAISKNNVLVYFNKSGISRDEIKKLYNTVAEVSLSDRKSKDLYAFIFL